MKSRSFGENLDSERSFQQPATLLGLSFDELLMAQK